MTTRNRSHASHQVSSALNGIGWLPHEDRPVNPFTVSAQMPALPGETQGAYEARLKRFLSPKTIGDKIVRWFWRR